jgi:hypothetical protein
MELGVRSLAACIASPRKRTSRTASTKSSEPAHHSAVYSPSESPATIAARDVSRPWSSRTRTIATLVTRMPGCAMSVRFTSSPRDQQASSSEKPSARLASANVSRARG